MWFTTVFIRSLVCSSNQYPSFFTMQILPVSNAIFSSGQIKRQRTIIFGMRRWRNRWTTCHLHPFVALQKIVPFTFLQEKKGHFLFLLFFGYFFFWRWMKEIVKCQKLLWWERKISLGIQDDDDHFFMLYWNTFRMTKGHKLNLKRKGIEQN